MYISVSLFSLVLIENLHAQQRISLWSDLPNSRGLQIEAVEENQRSRSFKHPELIAFFPNQEYNSGAAMIICPGGGYRHLAIHKEGYQVAKWLNTLGINAFVLKYRLPVSPDLTEPYKAPLQDAQRAIKYIRAHAEQYRIDSQKVGIMGFSAGGHLAATAGTQFETDWGAVQDSLDAVSPRPDLMILVYPVISMHSDIASRGSMANLLGTQASDSLADWFSLEKQVTIQTPPTFMVLSHDDQAVLPEHSIRFYQALHRKRVPAEMHIFQAGSHGFGLGSRKEAVGTWPELCENWLRLQNWIE